MKPHDLRNEGKPMNQSRLRRSALGALAALGLGLGVPPAQADDIDGVPVVGQAEATPTSNQDDGARKVLITLHSVRRVEGLTVVYWSVGLRADSKAGDQADVTNAFGLDSTANLFRRRVHGESMCNIGVIDRAAKKVYTPLAIGTDPTTLTCVGSTFVDAIDPTPGAISVAYAALPALPDEVERVSVTVAGRVFADVPVESGALLPAVSTDEPIAVGTGWPVIDLESARRADAESSIYPLTEHRADLTGNLGTRGESETTSVDIAADVLFAVDEAKLTPKARDLLRSAAKEITEQKATGRVTITGHTDSDGSQSHNLDLSTRRAQAAAKELRPLLPDGLEVTVDGKGESEPIASNETASGKQQNRRVTVTFTPGGTS